MERRRRVRLRKFKIDQFARLPKAEEDERMFPKSRFICYPKPEYLDVTLRRSWVYTAEGEQVIDHRTSAGRISCMCFSNCLITNARTSNDLPNAKSRASS